MKKVAFISGPMRGLSDYGRGSFQEAADKLTGMVQGKEIEYIGEGE